MSICYVHLQTRRRYRREGASERLKNRHLWKGPDGDTSRAQIESARATRPCWRLDWQFLCVYIRSTFERAGRSCFSREISERVGAFLLRSAPQAWHPKECFGLRTSMKTIPCAEYKHNSSAHSVLAIKSAHSIICHRTLRWQSWSPFHFQFGLGNSNFPHF
jgi:hypothetical protein